VWRFNKQPIEFRAQYETYLKKAFLPKRFHSTPVSSGQLALEGRIFWNLFGRNKECRFHGEDACRGRSRPAWELIISATVYRHSPAHSSEDQYCRGESFGQFLLHLTCPGVT
jgi:hypothetical protein